MCSLDPTFFSLLPCAVSTGKVGRAQRGICRCRHAVPIWEVSQISSRHCEEPEGEHGCSGEAGHFGQKSRKGMYLALFYIFRCKTNYEVFKKISTNPNMGLFEVF